MSEPLLSGDELNMLESIYKNQMTREAGTIRTLLAEINRARRERNQFRDAMLIYDASDPDYRINPSRFFDSDEAALADMKRLAEKELKP